MQVLVLAPTREIAVQIHSVVMAIGCAMEGLECHVFIGGRPVSQDKLHLKKCHVAVGSPGKRPMVVFTCLCTRCAILCVFVTMLKLHTHTQVVSSSLSSWACCPPPASDCLFWMRQTSCWRRAASRNRSSKTIELDDMTAGCDLSQSQYFSLKTVKTKLFI